MTGATEQQLPSVSGVIEDYKPKSGTKKDGSSWENHSVQLNGEWYSTFSETDGADLALAHQSGRPILVTYTVTPDGKYNNIKSVAVHGQATAAALAPEPAITEPPEKDLEVRKNEETGEGLVTLQKYQQAGNVVLFPTSYIRQISPYHIARVELVSIDVERDCYQEKNGEYAPKKPALERISDAAGLRWVTEKCVWVKAGPDSYMFTAVGAMQKPDGTWKEFSSTKEVILDVEYQESEERANAKDWNSDIHKQAYIKSEKLRIRKHAASMCESKAFNRVIRKALAMNQTYPKASFAKPLAIPRIDFLPDYSDPQVKNRFLESGNAAASDMYPQQPGPAHQPHAVDQQTGEIAEVEIIDAPEAGDDSDIPF
ncbi:MAG: hypothetical protein WC911_03710 [Thermoleophilia bacterium]